MNPTILKKTTIKKLRGEIKMKVGDRVRNIHTDKNYTIISIDNVIDGTDNIIVYEIANEKFDYHRVSSKYMKHYQLILEEE